MRDKLRSLMEKEGFILFLFLTVCILAGGTLFISMKNMNTNKAKIPKTNNELVILEDNYGLELDKLKDAESINLKEESLEEKSLREEYKEECEETIIVNSEDKEYILAEGENEELEFEEEYEEDLVEEKKFILPIEGTIITEYTSNSLVYSQTLESWVGHSAIDIEAAEGTIVKSAGDGVIKEVYEDQLWGIVIVIDHGGGIESRYLGLGNKEMVKEGISVKKGDHISTVGNTAKVEMLMKPHLHFEMKKDGKLIDPRSINK